MDGEIFDFDPVNEQNEKGYTQSEPDCSRYSIVDLVENELAHEERAEKGDHDYKVLQEDKIFNYLDNESIVKSSDINGGIEDEEAYDRYVPTDSNVVEDYLKQLEGGGSGEEVVDNEEDSFKLKHLMVSENDSSKIRFKKSIIGIYVPPENFARVCEGVYRSSFPRIENFQFLKSLGLKSILCLIPEDYPIENNKFNEKNGIKFYQIGLSGNKEPFVKIKPELVTEAIKIIIDPSNQPILIHCNRGKHRTGCIVGCIRKLQKWSHSMIFDEYRKFAYPKERPLDQQFIEMYNDKEVEDFANKNSLLPIQW